MDIDNDQLLSLDELRDLWNAQADAVNSWDALGADEIVWWAQRQALVRAGLAQQLNGTDPIRGVPPLLAARAALAEPDGPAVPEGREPASVVSEPSDEELLATLDKATATFPPRHPEAEALNAVEYPLALELRKARAVLARFGRQPAPPAEGDDVGDEARYLVKELRDQADDLSPTLELFGLIHRAADLLEQRHPAPVPVAVPEGREPAAIVGEPSDEELLKLARAELNNSPNWEEPEYDASNPFPYEAPGIAWLNFARAVLASWGHHSPDATKMVGPADGEVAELVARLRAIRNDYGMRHSADCRRAADLLEGLGSGWVVPTVEQLTPVPVSERLPGDELCWWFEADEDCGYGNNWTLLRIRGCASGYTHWLPATALPLPTDADQSPA